METTLKYKVITSRKQYNEYCKNVYSLLNSKNKTKEINEEIELLTVLIEKWDNEHTSFSGLDPIQLLKALMKENDLAPNDLMGIMSVTKGMVSEILNYRKGLSKHNIQLLASHFKVAQEAFNKHYTLIYRPIKDTNKNTSKNHKKLVYA